MAAKKKTTKKKSLSHPAVLKSLCPEVTCTFGALGAITLSAGSWQTLTSLAGTPFLFWEGSIDLQAYLLQDLTFVTLTKEIQEPGHFALSYATPQRLEFIEFITNQPMNRERLTFIADDWETGGAVPGMMNSRTNYENIILGRWRQISPDTTLPAASAMTLKSSSFGSTEPSASQKLYSYCMVKFDDISLIGPPDFVVIPGRRFLLSGAAVKEDDLQYLMRLRRSYVLKE